MALLIKQISCFCGCRDGWISWPSVNSTISFLLNVFRTFLYSLELFSVHLLGGEMFLFPELLYSWRNFWQCRKVPPRSLLCDVFQTFQKKTKNKRQPYLLQYMKLMFLKIFIKVLANCPWLHTSRYHGIIVSKNTLDCTRPLEII